MRLFFIYIGSMIMLCSNNLFHGGVASLSPVNVKYIDRSMAWYGLVDVNLKLVGDIMMPFFPLEA